MLTSDWLLADPEPIRNPGLTLKWWKWFALFGDLLFFFLFFFFFLGVCRFARHGDAATGPRRLERGGGAGGQQREPGRRLAAAAAATLLLPRTARRSLQVQGASFCGGWTASALLDN